MMIIIKSAFNYVTIKLFARMNIANCFDSAQKRMRAFNFKMRKKGEEEERGVRVDGPAVAVSVSKQQASGAATWEVVVLVIHQFRFRPSCPWCQHQAATQRQRQKVQVQSCMSHRISARKRVLLAARFVCIYIRLCVVSLVISISTAFCALCAD
jgi:hypothetical protein